MLLVGYAVVLVLMVLLGANTNKFVLLNHTRTQLIMSFVSGIMLGIAVFHLLPHALYAAQGHVSVDFVALWLMCGLVVMFLLQRVFHFHQHDFNERPQDCTSIPAHGGANDHSRDHSDDHEASHSPAELGSWGVLMGLALHSLLDGVALAASMQVDWLTTGHTGWTGLAGIGVFLAIFLHKPLDAMTIGMFLQRQGVRSRTRVLVLIAYGLMCPLAAGLILFGLPADITTPAFIVAALAFSAGIFLCIALSDLLPEIHFHTHDRGKMTLMLLLGIILSFALKNIESIHERSPQLGATSDILVEPENHH